MVFKQRCPELTWRVLNHQLMPAAVRLNLASTPQAIKPVASFPGRWHPLLQRLQQMDSSSDRVRQLSVDKLAQDSLSREVLLERNQGARVSDATSSGATHPPSSAAI
eukprot:scaffold328571_cov63-Tisochrysis_lutea.AAC.1